MTHIGILEDDEILRIDIGNALAGMGHQITYFDDADEGMALCAAESIDCFVVDLFIHRDRSFIMEGGLDFMSRLRDAQDLKTAADTPVVAITGGSQWTGGTDPLKTAVLAGATQIMRKPVNLIELLSAVQGLLGLDDETLT